MNRFVLVLVIAIIALMVLSWALGRVIFWLRATFPPNPPSSESVGRAGSPSPACSPAGAGRVRRTGPTDAGRGQGCP